MGVTTDLGHGSYVEPGGTLGEDAFNASLPTSAFVAVEILPHVPTDGRKREDVERAVAACVNCDDAWGGGGGSGPSPFSIGSFSM